MKPYLWLALFAAGSAHADGGRVAGTKHDLSVTGPGERRAVSERNPCVFCHTSHRGGGTGLSSRPDSQRPFKPYESSTMAASPGDPSGSSRICLSCHDGTIAIGQTRSRNLKMRGGDFIAPGQAGFIGTDLRGSHPVSFLPAGGRKGERPRPGDRVRLDRSGQVQCTSCHDPHSEKGGDPIVGMFLVKPMGRSVLCSSCHAAQSGSAGSTHATSTLPIRSEEGTPTTLAEIGCAACHDSHRADVRGRLLKAGSTDDAACLTCHSAAGVGGDVARQLAKPSSHSTRERGAHDAGEEPLGSRGRTLPETSVGARRHVACVDCHEPHSSVRMKTLAPQLPGTYGLAWGISIDGQRVAPARFEYEVCLKCHGDSANRPRDESLGGVQRARPDTNLRLVFGPSAASSHPVAAPGRNPFVPSLRPPLTSASVIYCTDCHGADDSTAASGGGVAGPHGSVYPFLLQREYRTADRTASGESAFALCFKCHDPAKLLSETSTFTRASAPAGEERALHSLHARQGAPCSACHDAHGVSGEAGTPTENAHLISFDLSIVGKTGGAAPRYTAAGPRGGSCNLTCHQTPHDDLDHRY